MVHLFDLCLWFDLMDTALALAMRGVEGCVLEDHHLGPFCRDSFRPCNCQGWDTCRYCSWAFPVEHGIGMKDWDVDLDDAIRAAQKAAATRLTRAMLDICSCDMELPFSGSPNAMARLLDIAILTGNQKATVNLAKKSQLRPLRRWAMDWDCEGAARTALWAGADFQDLMVSDLIVMDRALGETEDVPFPQALFLRSFEDWQEVRHLLPRCYGPWRPKNLDNWFGEYFFERRHGSKLSVDKIRAAEDAGVAVQFCFVWLSEVDDEEVVTLLDVAIWCGQPDCAEACVDRGIELMGDDKTLRWHKRVLRGESLRLCPGDDLLMDEDVLDGRSLYMEISLYHRPGLALDVVPSEAQVAAATAGRSWLKRSCKRESAKKGAVLYKMMVKMFKGRLFPLVLVQEILTFSMPVPKIIHQLDLWERVGDWMATICGRPASVHPAADCNTADVEETEGMQDNDEAGRLPFIWVLYLYLFCFHCLLPSIKIGGNHS